MLRWGKRKAYLTKSGWGSSVEEKWKDKGRRSGRKGKAELQDGDAHGITPKLVMER